MPEIKLTTSPPCFACEGALKLDLPRCDYHSRHPQVIHDYRVIEDPALD